VIGKAKAMIGNQPIENPADLKAMLRPMGM
jgi:hypothetical protein